MRFGLVRQGRSTIRLADGGWRSASPHGAADEGPLGPLESSIREAAGRLRRDLYPVHGNVTALLNGGLLKRAPGGGGVFPCDAVKVEFLLRAA